MIEMTLLAPPPRAPLDAREVIDRLVRLGDLLERDLLTRAEYEQLKARLLGR